MLLNANISRKRRITYSLFVSFIILALLLVRIGFIQFLQGEELRTMAYKQQSLDRVINPKRGTIYDATGKNILAISATVETVTINPLNIKEEDKEKTAKFLSDLFELDYEKTLKKVKKRSSIETIAKKIDKEKTDELRIWMKNNNITTGINIDEDTKRYYPNNELASHFIGFCGSDNQGLDGIEAKYEEVLKGSKGRIIKVTDAKGGEIGKEGENYVSAIDGKDLVVSVDMTIQSICEKYLKQACIDNICTDGGNVVAMNPKTGDILAMVTYPSYNLNSPYEITNEEIKANWESLTATERSENLQAMWRNKAIADTYEPGSTFKTVTSSAALQEGITQTDKEGEFCCTGGIEIAGVRIKCWRYYRPHGSESLRQALMNSCNPVFIGLGQKIGVSKYYEYLNKFGFLSKTGIELPGEAKGIFLKEGKVGPVELATISFGQRFEVTPLQMVTAVSTIANKGVRMKPRVIKKIIDSKTGEVEEIAPQEVERVIDEKTANEVLSMMESVVAEGTGKNAQVKGFRVGGKTGTSEDGVNTNKYVTSFIGVAPISDPQVVLLVTLYNPTGEGGHQGGAVAAPVGGQILGDVLPYLQLQQDNENKEIIEEVEVPELRNRNVKEAKKVLKEVGLEIETNIEITKEMKEEELIIKEQLPKPGIKVKKGSKISVEI
ncbi:MAG: PASTA domain-containing protein [Clostridia bacterium]|nr:PASTA domain-containing protein [Clostridia bacterium]